MEKVAEKETPKAEGGEKRTIAAQESELSTSSVECKTRRLEEAAPDNSASSVSSGNLTTCGSGSSGDVLASCCSSCRWSELTKDSSNADLEQTNTVTVELFASSAGRSVDITDRREKRSLNELEAQSGDSESTAMPRESNSRRCSNAGEMPSEAELEEFFAAAEKNLQKQFIDKYNYDIVKDEPVEGRYEWVPIRLKPCSMRKKTKKKALII